MKFIYMAVNANILEFCKFVIPRDRIIISCCDENCEEITRSGFGVFNSVLRAR